MAKLNLFGASGYVGGHFSQMYPDLVVKQDREDRVPKTNNILYMISTTDNYNVHANITLDVETNLKVLCEVLEHCKMKNIVFNFISSWFVYGTVDLPATEETPCNPTGFYSITKKCAEDLIISFCKTFGCKYRIIRLCNVIGGEDNSISRRKNALSHMVNCLKNNEDIYLYDHGTPVRDIMHVDDVCSAIKLICKKGKYNEIYNVGSGFPTNIGDFMHIAHMILKSNAMIFGRDAADFHKIVQAKDFYYDTTKLQSLGFKQQIPTIDIIRELCST